RGAEGRAWAWARAISLLGCEQRVDFLVGQLFLAVLAVNYQGGAARRHPHKVVAEQEHFLYLAVAFEHPEIGVALCLDSNGFHLGLEALIDPDAADFEAIASVDISRRGPLEAGLVAQVVHLH